MLSPVSLKNTPLRGKGSERMYGKGFRGSRLVVSRNTCPNIGLNMQQERLHRVSLLQVNKSRH